jgi:hypothetical protein
MFAFLLAAGSAQAQDTRCGGGFSARAGQHSQAYIDTRPGKPCSVIGYALGHSRGSSGIAITSGPRHGRASATSTGFRYAPNPGFRGKDAVTVRFNWNGPPSNRPSSGLVTFHITVE